MANEALERGAQHTRSADRASFTDLDLTVPGPWLHDAPLADLDALCHRLRSDLGLPARTQLARPVRRVVAAARHLASILPAAVASANGGEVVRAGLTATELDHLFRHIFARKHVTHRKPAPGAYLLAATRLRADPRRCLAFPR
ncbi:haloacid dehalogenase-like hydrolase [Kitasatospora sp. SolWspMP-SS2h]|uniref:HAD family hydrolase n=1 Tax=Kitasatospora sp. SolWspMP-SS2h TaxID=1305729 RepID=UPI000DBA1AF2|nr:HAD family hydrolase [Kitasatospora sp. SolWspMP-SS2h]RAJ44896.1 haloacid dehalogenase-like hydrolase [Kitasatospora sp. SolWspMP-SS2h]